MKRTMKTFAVSCSVALLSGCASNSGVLPIGLNTYMITRQAEALRGLDNLAGASIGEANRYCDSQGRAMHLIRMTESKPPYILGNYPRVEIRFSCDARPAR